MGTADDIREWRKQQQVAQQIAERQQRPDVEYEGTLLARAYQANPNLDPEAIVALALGGADEDLIYRVAQTATEDMMAAGIMPTPPAEPEDSGGFLGSAMNWFREGPIGDAIGPVQRAVARVGGETIGNIVAPYAKGASRWTFAALDSITQAAQNLGSDIAQGDFLTEILQGDLFEGTTAEVIYEQFADGGDVDMGTGWFPGGSVSTEQAEAARQRRGTINGRAWTLGRQVAELGVDAGVWDDESRAYDIASGAIDAIIAVTTDPSNYIPVAGWGDEVVDGIRGGRLAAMSDALHRTGLSSGALSRYTGEVELARYYEARGDIARALYHQERANDAIGVSRRLARIGDDEAVYRSYLRDRAGVISEGGRRTVLLPEFARFLTLGEGRRAVRRLIETDTVADVLRLHGGARNISPMLAVELASARSVDEVVGAYARAMALPGEDLARAVRRLPDTGLFRVGNAKMWVKRTASKHTRWGHIIPEDTRLPMNDPYTFGKNLEGMLDTLLIDDTRGILQGRYDQAARDALINKGYAALASENPADMTGFFNELADSFAERFVQMGFTQEEARAVTQWSKHRQDLSNFLYKDLSAGVPVVDGAPGSIPALVTQMLSHGATVIDPATYTYLLHHTSRVRNALRRASRANLDDDGAGRLATAVHTSEAVSAGKVLAAADRVQHWAEWAMSWWRPLMITRAAYLLRVIPEEMARVSTSGVMNPRSGLLGVFASAIHHGRANLDAAGRRFVAKQSEMDALSTRFDDLTEQIAEATKAGRNVDDLVAQRNALDAEMDMVHEELARMAVGYDGAVIGRNGHNATAMILKDKRQQYQAARYSHVSLSNTAERGRYIEGYLDRISFYSNDPVMQRIAGRGVGPRSRFKVDGVEDTVSRHIAAGRLTDNGEDAIIHWLMTGGGYQFAKARENAARVVGMNWRASSWEDVSAWVHELTDEVAYIAGAYGARDPVTLRYARDNWLAMLDGADQDILDAIARGRFNGKPIVRTSGRSGNFVYDDGFRAHLEEYARSENGRAPQMLMYDTGRFHAEDVLGIKALDTPAMRHIADFFFGNLYGRTSDYLSRSPSFRNIYWKKITHLIASLDPNDAATVVRRAEQAGLTQTMMKNIRERARLAYRDGDTATIDEIDAMARSAALTDVRDLLFDATKKGAFFDQMRLVFPFGDAWKEVYEAWVKIMVLRKGRPAKSLLKGVRAAQNATGLGQDIYGYDPTTGEYTAMPDGKREGFLWKDPTSGEWMFSLPLSQEMSKLFQPGYPGTRMVAPARNLNIAGNIFPGFGPIVDQVVAYTVPDDPRLDGLREWLFPFGAPAEADTPAGRALDMRRVLPGWLRRLPAVAADTELGGFVYNYLNNVDNDPSFLATQAHVFKQYLSTLDHVPGHSELADITKQARTIALRIYSQRGLGQFFGPASPQPQYTINTADDENVIATLLSNELNKAETAAIINGEDRDQAVIDFLDTYGPEVWAYMASNSKSLVPGMEATDEWWDWYRLNEDIVEQYPNVGGFFGPAQGREAPFSLDAYQGQMDRGMRHINQPEAVYDDAARSLAWIAYSRVRDRMPPESERTPEDQIALGAVKRELEQYFGVQLNGAEQQNLRRTQINELNQIVVDALNGNETALKMLATPQGQALAAYMDMRTTVRDAAINELGLRSQTSWAQAKSASRLRDTMRALARDLSAVSPEFRKLYDTVLEGEMTDDAQGDA
jgi:hypothetical protein